VGLFTSIVRGVFTSHSNVKRAPTTSIHVYVLAWRVVYYQPVRPVRRVTDGQATRTVTRRSPEERHRHQHDGRDEEPLEPRGGHSLLLEDVRRAHNALPVFQSLRSVSSGHFKPRLSPFDLCLLVFEEKLDVLMQSLSS